MPHHLHIDAFAGLAGDMFLGACVGLGAPIEKIIAALQPLPIDQSYRITTTPTQRHAISAIDLKVQLDPPSQTAPTHAHQHHHGDAHSHNHSHNHDHSHHHHHGHGHAHEHHHSHAHHHHTGYRDICAMIDRLDTTDRARQRAHAIVRKLAEAEAAVHDKSIEHVHFHEVGAVDSIVDMLGAAVALELLDVASVSCSALPLGHGFVQCDHGRMPLPAPATALILQNVPTYGVDRACETVTPTGAAIAAALAQQFGPQPPMQVAQVGCGAGDRDDPDIPNLVRLFLGQKINI